MRADSPASTREESRLSPHIKRGGLSHIWQLERNPEVYCCNAKGHRVPPQLKISPDSPALTPVEPQISPHNMKGGLTPLLHLYKKPSSPPQLKRSPDTSFTTREESGVPCLNKRQGLIPLLKLDRNLKIPVSSGEEPRVSCISSR